MMNHQWNESQPICRQLRDRVVAMILNGVLSGPAEWMVGPYKRSIDATRQMLAFVHEHPLPEEQVRRGARAVLESPRGNLLFCRGCYGQSE
jgi:hypothetical protein